MPPDRGMERTLRYAALALVVAACGGPVTGPTPVAARLANPATTFNQLQAISAVTSTPLFESFTVLAPRFTPASATGSVALALALDFAARYSPWRRGVPFPLSTSWRGGQGVRPSLLTTRSSPPIPFSATWAYATTPGPALGTTFVWDPDTCGYIASADSGAPANGERFVLYAISQRSGLPSVPVSPIGYVDLTAPDSSGAGVTLVGTPAGAPATTYASYSVAAGAASATSLVGFVTDGTTRLELDVRSDSTTTPGALTVISAIAVPTQNVQVSESVTVSGGDTARMTTDLRLASDGETVRATGDVTIDTTSRIGSGEMTVSVNDCAFATITLGGPDLVFDPAPGVTFSTEDETTLRALFSTSFELYGTERVLLIPVPLSRSSPPVPLSTIPQAGPSLARVPRPPFVSRSSASRSFARARAARSLRMTTPRAA